MSSPVPGIPPAPSIEGAEHVHSGKVRDLYRLPDGRLLMVASDRISAYDFVLSSTIPDKGAILTQMSLWWFDQLADLVPNHIVSTDVPDEVKGRAVVCESLDMYAVECVVRGYLTGSGLADYRAHRRGLRHPAAAPASRTAPGCRSRSSRPPPRPRSATTTRTSRTTRWPPRSGADAAAHAARPDAGGLRAGRGDRPRARDHPGRHQARVRRPAGRHRRARRRGAHPGLVALLAGRPVAARAGAAVVRQADRARLADVAGQRLGPALRARRRRRCRTR